MSWLKTKDARAYIAVGEKQFERIVASGQLSFVRLPSGHRRFATSALDAWMSQYEVGGASIAAKAAADRILGYR